MLVAGCGTSGGPPAATPDAGRAVLAVDIPSSGQFTRVTHDATRDPGEQGASEVWEDCFSGEKGILYGNLVTQSSGSLIAAGETIGRMAPFPEPRSKRFESELLRSEALYTQRHYTEAASVLRPAWESKRYDAFVANAYARALYWTSEDRGAAFEAYRTLVGALDSFGAAHEPGYVYVDMWFGEAYWKLGTLHMDRREYREAICQMERSLYANGDPTNLYLEQLYSYLAEAYFELGRADRADAYAREALRRNPANTSVRRYLAGP